MNEENIRRRIRALLEEIQNEADPVLLNRCRSLFRREVSFFRRSYMAAYLLLVAEGEPVRSGSGRAGASGRSGRSGERSGSERSRGRAEPFQRSGPPSSGGRDRQDRRDRREGKREEGRDKGRTETSPLSDEESARLFVSIGRNRRVFARDILALVNARARIDRDDIGTIRILDNYSFVQVRSAAADAIIAALNGQSFRGRTLTVNYARGRGEGEEAADSPEGRPAYDPAMDNGPDAADPAYDQAADRPEDGANE